jgi:diacylglycerol kinase family enzyme
VKRAALIVNPIASSVTPERVRAVEGALKRHVDLETLTTAGPGDATELARSATRVFDAVVAFSGDGVFNEILNGIERDVPLGFVPGGRTNVLPRALGLPRDPVRAAARVEAAIAEGRLRRISLGRVNGRRFAFAAGLGVDAELIRALDERRSDDGRLPGDFTAARLLVARLVRNRREAALDVEGIGCAAAVLVANGDPYTYVGALPLRLVPQARFELGLDVAALRSAEPARAAAIAARALLGRQDPSVLYRHDVDRVEVRSDAPVALQADGEDLGDVEHVVFEVERDAVSVLV